MPLGSVAELATMRVENLGKALWRGKVFFRSQGVLRNRIEDIAILKPLIKDSESIPKLTFDGATTWLLFPAKLSCGESQFDPAHKSIVIDYSVGSTIEGYREIPDALAGQGPAGHPRRGASASAGLLPGTCLFPRRFGLNFTLVDPAVIGSAAPRPPGD